jgi:hypothetical protein
MARTRRKDIIKTFFRDGKLKMIYWTRPNAKMKGATISLKGMKRVK